MNYVLYHASCVDGFAAAAIAYSFMGRSATYIPCQYGKSNLTDLVNQNKITPADKILVVDFSFPFEQIEKCPCVIEIYDHHESFKNDAEKVLALNHGTMKKIIFDMSQCGSMLTFKNLFPGNEIPKLLHYIQDRDLWKWDLVGSKEISATIATWPKENTFDNFENWLSKLNKYPSDFVESGIAILAYQKILISNAVRNARVVRVTDGSNYFDVLAVNSPCLQSEICDTLITEKGTKTSASYYHDIERNKINWSIRGENAGAIAKMFGGGGHPRAGGFSTDSLPEIV